VMNTDNMSILGLTIDYGPYGWLENYDPQWTPNTTDAAGRRYRFGAQPQVAHWNFGQLANALYPLIQRVEPLQAIVDDFGSHYLAGWRSMMAYKLGLSRFEPATDEALIAELLALLPRVETDMTIFFRKLADMRFDGTPPGDGGQPAGAALLEAAFYRPEQLTGEYRRRLKRWLGSYQQRLAREKTPAAVRRKRMNAVNPKYVLRNYMAQLAIDRAEQGDFALIDELLELLRRPYDEQPEQARWARKRPEWARNRPGCSMLSCSS